jgi:pyruvate ferredoxin oxidoreductase beta subunit
MSTFPVYIPKLLPREENFVSGRRSCKGCGKALSIRMISKMMGNKVKLSSPAQGASFPGRYNQTSPGFIWDEITSGDLTTSFVDRLLAENQSRINGGKAKSATKAVVGIDRRIFSKDLLALPEMLSGEKNVVYVCYDSEMYMSEMLKRSAPSLDAHHAPYDLTKEALQTFIQNKNIPSQVKDFAPAYSATACPSFPLDLMEKIQKALTVNGPAFISVLTPCPTAWLFKPELTAQLGDLAVNTGFYPLYEMEDGTLQLTKRVAQPKPLSEYFKLQQRYLAFPSEWLALLQEVISEEYEKLVAHTTKKGV